MLNNFYKNIIFTQKRTGLNGKTFVLYKFRTMVKNAESIKNRNINKYKKENQAPWPMFKNYDDPRFIKKVINLPFGIKKEIKIGRWLSKTGLDELPQLINIIKGEMKLVGPRPLPIKEANAIKKIDPKWWQWRHQIKPGIFSHWTLDKNRYKSLEHWKRLEKKTLKANIVEKIKVVLFVIKEQIKAIFDK